MMIHPIKLPFTIPAAPGVTLERFVYASIIYGKEITLIDSGVAASKDAIFDSIRQSGRRPEEISTLILTHSHPDHIGSAKAIKEATGCALLAHAAERAWIEDTELQARERPVPGFNTLVGGQVKVDRVLSDGDNIDLDGIVLEIFHTPGHSRGSISLFLRDEGALFSADAVPVPGAMPIFEDISASEESVKKLASLKGINHLFSAWDEPREGADACKAIFDGLDYLRRIREAVMNFRREGGELEPMELCRLVLKEIGLPEGMANPLVARGIAAIK